MTVEGRTLVLMPALNEERSVGQLVTEIRAAGLAVCVISDGSADRTAAVARLAGATVLEIPVNVGVGGALRCGFRYALAQGYEIVVQVDADGQHAPSSIEALLSAMRTTGADMVVGSRFAGGARDYEVSHGRRLAMRLLARYARRATGVEITDATSGFRAIRRPLLDRFAADYPAEYLGDTVEALVLAGRAGAVVVEQPVTMSPRLHGEGSAGFVTSLWYVARVLIAVRLMYGGRSRRVPALATDGGAAD